MDKKRYLLIVEDKYVAAKIMHAYERVFGQLNFDFDIAHINCRVQDISNGFAWITEDEEDVRLDITHIGNIPLPSHWKIVTNMYTRTNTCIARILLKRHRYDMIVNCCGPNERWDFAFDYMLDTLNVYLPNKRRLPIMGMMDEKTIGSLLLLLNDTQKLKELNQR